MKHFVKVIATGLILMTSIFHPLKSVAQADPLCDPLCNCYPDGTLCPIDDGVYFLIAAVIGLAAMKTYRRKKQSTVSL